MKRKKSMAEEKATVATEHYRDNARSAMLLHLIRNTRRS
ncbi:hypothetical protein ECDEC6E_1770 [Escherichia coli DEC6E]|nr:hypothetical protein ECDEC6E_1770 [Escherichia coli DEC6E]